MKDFIKLLSVITGLFRSIITIIFLLAIILVGLADVGLLSSSIDILGYYELSKGLIKPILMVIFAICFIFNFIISKHIFKAGETGQYHISNLCFALLFIIIDGLLYLSLRKLDTPLIYILIGLNALIVINSILGIIAKSRGGYTSQTKQKLQVRSEEKPKEYIEFSDDQKPVKEKKDYEVNNLPNDQSNTGQSQNVEPSKNKTEQTFKKNNDETNDSYKLLAKDQKLVFESKKNKEKSSSPNIDSKPIADESEVYEINNDTNKIDE